MPTKFPGPLRKRLCDSNLLSRRIIKDGKLASDRLASTDLTMTERKEYIRQLHDELAPERNRWLNRGAFFHSEDIRYLKFLIPAGVRILELGCGNGHLLSALKPSKGVGIDLSSTMVAQARLSHPHLHFIEGDIEDEVLIKSLPGPFDAIVIADTLGSLDDCQHLFETLQHLCTRETRLIVAYFSHLWYPALKLAEWLKLRMPQRAQNVLSPADIRSLAELAEFETIKSEVRILSPLRLLGLGRLINRFIAPFPIVRLLCLRHYSVCRSLHNISNTVSSASVIVPARNERGNIEAVVRRIPRFTENLEIVFVEGHSQDGTWDEIQRVVSAYPQYKIRAMQQPGIGKADAVFAAFEIAAGDVLMILDADLTMPPEQLPKFWGVIQSGKGEFVNGSRLVYPMEKEAMRFLNLVANKAFSLIFTWLLSQRLTDTLCGTKALRRSDYRRLKDQWAYFGGFDPFGDFVLIFGASKLGLKIVEIPIRYANRTYGQTQISRFRHGLILLRMVFFAFLRIKAM
jgi:SAM-dependent methyltransferase